MDKTNRQRNDYFATITNTRLPFASLNPLLALFKILFDRIKRDEELFASSFLFGGIANGFCIPLSVEFTDWCDSQIASIIFGKDNKNAIKSHSSRKGGATSYSEAGLTDQEIRILGRWSIGILDFYKQTTPRKFSEMHRTMAAWAVQAFKDGKYIAPVTRD